MARPVRAAARAGSPPRMPRTPPRRARAGSRVPRRLSSPPGTARDRHPGPRWQIARGGGLASKLLPELQQMAQSMGIKGTGRMRKGELILAIQERQGGAAVAARRRSPARDRTTRPSEAGPREQAPLVTVSETAWNLTLRRGSAQARAWVPAVRNPAVSATARRPAASAPRPLPPATASSCLLTGPTRPRPPAARRTRGASRPAAAMTTAGRQADGQRVPAPSQRPPGPGPLPR